MTAMQKNSLTTPEAIENECWDPEPRWPALIAVLAVAGLFFALPKVLRIGPLWLFPAVVGVLLLPTVITHRIGQHNLDRILGFVVSGLVTLGLIVSVVRLVQALIIKKVTGIDLLIAAAALWPTNILVFALWYWRLDAGGPHGRDGRFGHPDGDFLFPQMTLGPEEKRLTGQTGWSPSFLDYLFVAFNTSAAFSPTDAPVLARRAKVLSMIQSTISLAVLVLLAARAVNIVGQ